MINLPTVPKDKTALVTGGSEGIGKSIVDSLIAAGNRVIIVDKKDLKFEETRGNANVLFIKSDLMHTENCQRIVEVSVDRFHGIDILINNAGFQFVSSLEQFPEDVFRNMINLMVVTPFALSKLSIPLMKEKGWGRIINIASIHGMVASPFKAGYITAKHALVGLTKAISSESAPHGITCNAIAPFYVNTNLVTDQIRAQALAWGTSEDRVVEDILLKNSPVKRLIEPHEIASLAMYLCTDESSAINGAVLPIDHGYTSQ